MIDALLPAELAYRGVNRVRRRLYRNGILRSARLPRPVLSIGNRAIGGSGKTPAVLAIARMLRASGKRVAILTRGYGRTEAAEPLRVDRADPARFGDEPSLIHEALPDVPVIVGGRRARAARWFLERGDCDLFLLDDGFQHLQLERDVDVVIENGSARRFREGESALADADIVLLRNGATSHTALPSFDAELLASAWIAGREARPLDALRGKSAVAFAGLADNAQFFRMLVFLGVELRETISFRDHQRYGASELLRIEEARRRSGAELVLTTEKDRVKVDREEVTALRVELRIDRSDELTGLLLARLAGSGEYRVVPS